MVIAAVWMGLAQEVDRDALDDHVATFIRATEAQIDRMKSVVNSKEELEREEKAKKKKEREKTGELMEVHIFSFLSGEWTDPAS